MALFETHSRANKRQDGDLDVRYLSDVVKITANGPVYHVTRIASKSYEYFGMTKAAANECKRDKQFNNDFKTKVLPQLPKDVAKQLLGDASKKLLSTETMKNILKDKQVVDAWLDKLGLK